MKDGDPEPESSLPAQPETPPVAPPQPAQPPPGAELKPLPPKPAPTPPPEPPPGPIECPDGARGDNVRLARACAGATESNPGNDGVGSWFDQREVCAVGRSGN